MVTPSKKAPSSRSATAGMVWEYRISRLRFYQGYLVARSVDLWPPTDSRKLGEIDAMVVSFDPQLRSRIEVLECKTGASGSGEIDRLFWLRGLADFVGSHDSTLAKLRVDPRVRLVARRIGVDILDTTAVEAAELAAGVAEDGWLGFHDPEFGERVVKPLRETLTSSQPLRRAGRFLFGTYWLSDPFVQTKQLKTLIGLLASERAEITKEVGLLAMGVAATLFARSVFAITSWRNQYDDDEFRSFVQGELTAGIADVASLRPLLRRIDQLQHTYVEDLHARYAEGGVARVVSPLPNLESTMLVTPEWAEGLLDLSDRLRRQSRIANDVLRVLDLRAAARLGGRPAPNASGVIGTSISPVTSTADLIEDFLASVWSAPHDLLSEVTDTLRTPRLQMDEPTSQEALPMAATAPDPQDQIQLDTHGRGNLRS